MAVKSRSGFFFRPNLGLQERELFNFLIDLEGANDVSQYVSDNATDAKNLHIRWAFCLSLLSDIVAAGGKLSLLDSVLYVTWPEWRSGQDKELLRSALEKLRDELIGDKKIDRKLLSTLPSKLAPSELLEVVSKGRVKLEEVSSGNNHPSGFHYGEIYNAARRYAVMPDRGREGRRKRFVLTITNPSDGIITPMGLLEASDGPPQDSIRDSELYLTPKKFTDWLLNNPNKTRTIGQLLERLDKIKSALRPIKVIDTGMDLESEEIVYKEHKKLNAIASGRSKLFEKGDKQDPLWDKKKINYLVGIVRFKHALIQIQDGKEYTANDISNGVRILRNLSIPRSNLDISICVGLPPFSYALIGKLLIAFFGDPRIRAIAEPKQSIILKKVFFFNRLNELLPKDGALVITTKGLYPGYSVQYERAHAPGKEGNIRLRKVGHTVGETTSFISQRTDVLGKELMEYLDEAQASSTFGSGGSKRQRRIETAVDAIGLPREMVHPKFNRPIYSLRLVDNIPEIIYLNEKPNWLVPEVTPDEYELLAQESWFQRWKNTIEKRIFSVENDHIHGLQEVYEKKGWVIDE